MTRAEKLAEAKRCLRAIEKHTIMDLSDMKIGLEESIRVIASDELARVITRAVRQQRGVAPGGSA